MESLLLLIETDSYARERLGHDDAVAGNPDTEIAMRLNYAAFLAASPEDRERAAQATLLCLWAATARGTTWLEPHPESPYAEAWRAYEPVWREATAEAERVALRRQRAAQDLLDESAELACRGVPLPREEHMRRVALARAAESAYTDYLGGDDPPAVTYREARARLDYWREALTGGPGGFNALARSVGVLRALPLAAAAR